MIEVDRNVDGNGVADLAGHRLKVGPELAHRRVTLRLDGHLVHVICGGVLAKTLPSPVPAASRGKLRGARLAAAALPPPAPGPVSVQRKVPRDGVILVIRQGLRVGATYAREDRHRPRRGHPLPRHLRRRRDRHANYRITFDMYVGTTAGVLDRAPQATGNHTRPRRSRRVSRKTGTAQPCATREKRGI